MRPLLLLGPFMPLKVALWLRRVLVLVRAIGFLSHSDESHRYDRIGLTAPHFGQIHIATRRHDFFSNSYVLGLSSRASLAMITN